MSSRSEVEREVARAVADAREAAREITHSHTESARVLAEGNRRLGDDDDAHVEQQAVQQGAMFLAGVTGSGDTVGEELVEFTESTAEVAEATKDPAAGKARNHVKD